MDSHHKSSLTLQPAKEQKVPYKFTPGGLKGSTSQKHDNQQSHVGSAVRSTSATEDQDGESIQEEPSE
jgi:hypothetical protein